MTQNNLRNLWLIVLCLICISCSEYSVINTDDGLKITGYKGKDTVLIIPSEIKKKQVRIIGEGAFSNKELNELILPETLISIEERAFADNNLTNIIIPQSVTNIGKGAFSNNHLKNIILTPSISSIEDDVFLNNSLEYITLPDTITNIGNKSFASNKLKDIVIPKETVSIGGSAFKNNKLIKIEITQNVKYIGISAFSNNLLEIIKIPDGLHCHAPFSENPIKKIVIGNNVHTSSETINIFKNLTGIIYFYGDYFVEDIDFLMENSPLSIFYYAGDDKRISIPEHINGKIVTSIGSGAFKNKSLEQLELPVSIQTIEKNAFENNYLKLIKLPEGLKNIESRAFSNNGLSNIIIPDSVTSIGDDAFYGNKISSLRIGNNVKLEYHNIFGSNSLVAQYLINGSVAGTYKIRNINGFDISKSPLNYIVHDKQIVETVTAAITEDKNRVLFEIENPVIIFGYYGANKNITIPNTYEGKPITVIAQKAFFEKSLQSLTISNTIKIIDDFAFNENFIKKLIIPGSVKYVGESAFSNNPLTNVVINQGVEQVFFNAFFPSPISGFEKKRRVFFPRKFKPFNLDELMTTRQEKNEELSFSISYGTGVIGFKKREVQKSSTIRNTKLLSIHSLDYKIIDADYETARNPLKLYFDNDAKSGTYVTTYNSSNKSAAEWIFIQATPPQTQTDEKKDF